MSFLSLSIMYDIVYNNHFAKANKKHTECVITPNRQNTVITFFHKWKDSTAKHSPNIFYWTSILFNKGKIHERTFKLKKWNERKLTYLFRLQILDRIILNYCLSFTYHIGQWSPARLVHIVWFFLCVFDFRLILLTLNVLNRQIKLPLSTLCRHFVNIL